ncbi:hypothetical protein Bca4012_103277 [Brassica carinata]
MCSVKTAYLTNSEEFCHEVNFHGILLDLDKRIDSLTSLELSNSGFMHLSLPKGFEPGMRQVVERPYNGERLKENQGQHLTCPQHVEEDTRNNKSTQAVKEQIILQLAETIWEQRLKIP